MQCNKSNDDDCLNRWLILYFFRFSMAFACLKESLSKTYVIIDALLFGDGWFWVGVLSDFGESPLLTRDADLAFTVTAVFPLFLGGGYSWKKCRLC